MKAAEGLLCDLCGGIVNLRSVPLNMDKVVYQ